MSSATKPVSPLRLLVQLNLLHAWRRMKSIRDQSQLMVAVICAFIVGYLGFSFWLFQTGLRFLGHFPGLGTLLVERLLFLLFAFLFVLLLFSNLVIGYTNYFRNKETLFLLPLPIPHQTIFRWKFLESVVLASWAFLFLIAPLLTAYGMANDQPWHFYLMTLVLMALFIALPGIAGAWAAVNLARYLDRRTFQVLAILLSGALLISAFSWLRAEPIPDDAHETRVLVVMDRLLVKTRFAHWPLLPSYWLSQSVLQWGEGALKAAAFFALVLLSHVLFFGYLAFTRMGNIFFEAFSRVHSRESALGRWQWFQTLRQNRPLFDYSQTVIERTFRGFLGLMREDVRAVVMKDARMFWRDTAQWGQTLVLFGLLGMYVINLRHFTQQLTNPFWIHLVSYLNLGACSLNLATLTTRFVFPQFSLEGKRLWIVGLAPLGLRKVVEIKFWLAGIASLLVTFGLILLSCRMLKMSWDRTAYFAVTITVMTLTLNGLAVGLGVLFPNFREDNPSKIVSGFGGTFCLVMSFLYIVGAILILALGSPWGWKGGQSPVWIISCWTGFTLFSMLLGYLPLALALKRLEKFEL